MNSSLSNLPFTAMRWLCLFGMVATVSTAFAAPAPPETPAVDGKKYSSPSLVPIKDVPGLPRVLLIGDSISMGYTLPTRAALSGKANVHRAPTNCGSTLSGVQNLDEWLGAGHWDVIHFNWGMHDLKYLENGKQNVPPAVYEANLQKLVARLQRTGATLIFATTTPIPEYTKGVFKRHQGDVKTYNDIAEKIMKSNGIMIDDLYAFALPKMSEIQVTNDVHQTKQGALILSQKVASSILEALATRSAMKQPDQPHASSTNIIHGK